ncbi:spindle assembly abnormal protein 6 homolog isoform X2 [Periplaneta americana]|uniref:spindle assembly abnormal protein 6 homolog isoform X2 n=1 Tax=Periplaneta americana TaxID=6978 RepID=UPI0037E874E6
MFSLLISNISIVWRLKDVTVVGFTMKSVGHRMNDDRVNSLTSEIVYLEHQKVFLRTKGKEDRTKLFKLLVSVVTAESSASDKSLSIEVTDDNDPFVLYSLLVSESDFQIIKEQQGLLIEYDKFSFQLSKLLHLCKSNSDDGGNYRLVIEETGEETFGNKKTVMKIVETNQFKQLCHLILEIGVGTDNEIKKHMADQLKTLKEALHNAEKKISEQEIRAENTARKLEQKEQEIEKLREEWREDSNAVSEKAKEQINTERENAIRVQQDMREAFENEKKQLQTIILETKKSFELLVEELQTEKKLLIEQNCQTDSRLRDLNNKIDSLYKENCSLQQEVTMLLSQNSKLDAGYHEKEKNLNLTKKKYAMLEQNLLEENIVKKNSEIARLNNSLQTLTEENTNANDIITSFQNEFPILKAKIKLRTKIILEQESILAQRDSNKTALEKETEELKKKVGDLKATEKELSELLQTTKEKLNQKEEALTSNKHLINYLNKRLHECETTQLQSSTKTITGASGLTSTPRLALVPRVHKPLEVLQFPLGKRFGSSK